ncbi:MAG: hypothetical protein RDV48_28560 [Candidatus Eremiobacteraeota bacterium]|nr:hypothetical protein [Candidatus Eremiobacteraeota bacterium]
MYSPYVPEKFCREFVEVKRNSSQISLIMATVLGHKPLMDDWVPREALPDYLEICARYGLHARVDALFVGVPRTRIPDSIVGREYITSTSAFGAPVEADIEGQAHVFLSKRKELLLHGMWYPLIIRGRVIQQPRADTLRYGSYLGYPECCISFFRFYNNWKRYSFLYEIHRNTRGGAPPHYLCNPLTKDSVYSYIYHMPCSWRCRATIRQAEAFRKALLALEPEFVRRTDKALRLPYLVFYERHIYGFRGVIKGNRLHYQEAYSADLVTAPQSYLPQLREGDSLVVEGETVKVFKGKDHLADLQGNSTLEKPFLIQFK